MFRPFLSVFFSVLIGVVCSAVGSCRAEPTLFKNASPATCRDLRETLAHPRWLELPMSRLVVNPFLGHYGGHGNAEGIIDGVLPLNLAYYVGSGPARLPAFCYVQPFASPARRGFVAGPRFDLSNAAQWQTRGAQAVFGPRTARVTPLGDFGAILRTVTIDLDKTPYLVVQTPPGSPSFDLKVNSGSQPVDTFLHPAERLGAMTANVAAETGWHGVKTFQVLFYALGKGTPTTLTRVQFAGLPALPAISEKSDWMPQEILSRASLEGTAGKISCAITLPDADTVTERLHLGPNGPAALVLAGQFDGSVRWNAVQNTLLLQGRNFRAVLCVSRKAKWLGERPTQADWAFGDMPSRNLASGVWRLALDNLKPGEDIIVSARFAPSTKTPTLPPVSLTAFLSAAARNEADWNERLARVPRPLDFTPRHADAKGMTADEVRRSYYRAWVFFLGDTLPPMPENSFPYPQVCTGKPSLWTDGGTHMEETALWDSSAAMQALALVQPQNIWEAAQGILSQVDADGYLYGEALPTIFARTLWLLYRQTGDMDRLRGSYPALKRFLLWKIANPRWIYPNRTKPAPDPQAPKDQEFVSHEIVDLDFAAKITQALGMPDEAKFWRRQQQAAITDYQNWFWPVPGDHVYRIYGSDMNRGDPDDPWSLQGLQISPLLLPPSDSAMLVALYKKTKNDTLPFFVPGRTRFGDLNPILRGLFQQGQAGETAQLTDVCLRDVTRAGEFAEDYTQESTPGPNGVRPSSFGARLLTDSLFWHNGVALDEGFPVLLGMPGAVGVDNIPVCGDPISIRYDSAASAVTLRGPGLVHLRLPVGFHTEQTPSGAMLWTGLIFEGRQIPLEGKK